MRPCEWNLLLSCFTLHHSILFFGTYRTFFRFMLVIVLKFIWFPVFLHAFSNWVSIYFFEYILSMKFTKANINVWVVNDLRKIKLKYFMKSFYQLFNSMLTLCLALETFRGKQIEIFLVASIGGSVKFILQYYDQTIEF